MSTMHLTLDTESNIAALAVGTLLVNSKTGETWRRHSAIPRNGVGDFILDWSRTDAQGFARQADREDWADLWESLASGEVVAVWMPLGARLPQ